MKSTLLHRAPLRLAAVALLAAGTLFTAGTASAALPESTVDTGPAPDAPISGKLVPALRGEAARAATGPLVGEQFRELGEARHAVPGAKTSSITPWTGALHVVWGSFPSVNSDGAQATHTINPGIHLSATNPDVVYAPTLDPSGKTCIEVTTFYWQGGNGVGAWDWCAASPGFAAVSWIDTTFVNTYTSQFQGVPAYTVQDVQTNATTNSWTAYLYNYTTSSWDALFTSADPGKLTNPGGGWDMFEVYTNYNSATGQGHYCTETYGTQFHATNIKIKVGGTWSGLTTANSSVTPPGSVSSTSFGCNGLTFSLPTANSHWQVTN
ncbi:carbohydrate-binding protein [Actinosynnema sp. NPDC020468]|uniref:carbohydrate-binding protein n=1 Tax=Actinosynnema sp. NPDC020468 TaxID=3154488 RepID=UPI0033ED9F19